MEIAGWERAHGYAANEATLLAKYANRVPERLNEWDNRHFWRVSNAEHLELSENVGMVNLSHFAIYDVSGRDIVDRVRLLLEGRGRHAGRQGSLHRSEETPQKP